MKLDRENAALTAAGQQPRQKKFETAKETLRKQISDVLDNAVSFEDFSDRLMQQYGITVKESRGQLSYLPAGRKKFIRANILGDKFDKAAVLATLQANAEAQTQGSSSSEDTRSGRADRHPVEDDARARASAMSVGATKHNLKAMAQTVILLQEKGLDSTRTLSTSASLSWTPSIHESLAVVKDLEGRMADNQRAALAHRC